MNAIKVYNYQGSNKWIFLTECSKGGQEGGTV